MHRCDFPTTFVVPLCVATTLALALCANGASGAPPPELPELQRPSLPKPPPAEAAPETTTGSDATEGTEPGPEPTDPGASSPAEPAEPGASPPEPSPTEPTDPGASPPPPPSCPCDELDWVCRQNDPACTGDTASPAMTAEPRETPSFTNAPTPTAAPAHEDEPTVELDPRGMVLELGAGLGGCRQDLCDENPISFLGRGALGYRLPRVAFVANVMVGGGPKTDDTGGVLLVEVDAGFELFLASTERVDPYVGAGLGYMRLVETRSDNEMFEGRVSDTTYYSRGALRVGAGMPVHLRRGWSVGPRFDYVWGLLGRRCARGDCTSTSDIVDSAGDSAVPRREERQSFPRPWSLTVEFRRQF